MLNINYIQNLRRFIDSNPCIDFDARSAILYPLLDRIYNHGEQLFVTLQNGVKLHYLYKSQISKEILLREREIPSHAWEPMTTRAVELAIRYRPGLVIIGGAYFGDHAMIAAKELQNMKSNAHVICVEPNIEQGKLLVKNAFLNQLSKIIKLNEVVLWDVKGLKFKLENEDSLASVIQSEQANCVSDTIDNIFLETNSKAASLLMLDIEGSEEKALQGAKNMLGLDNNCAPVIITEVHRNYVNWENGLKDTTIVQLLENHGYYVYALRDAQSNWELGLDAPEIIPLDKINLFGPPHGFNLIASKKKTFYADSGFKLVENVSPKYLRHKDKKLHYPVE